MYKHAKIQLIRNQPQSKKVVVSVYLLHNFSNTTFKKSVVGA